MDDATFLRAARAMLDAAERGNRNVSAAPSTWRRLLEMAERWQAHEELCRAAADVLNPPPSAPSDAMP